LHRPHKPTTVSVLFLNVLLRLLCLFILILFMLFKPCFALVFDMFAFPAALCWCALALWLHGYLLILGPIVVLFSLHFDWSRARLGLPVIHYVNSAFDKRMPMMFNVLRILPDVVKCIVI
jgi:hypothetical protein